MLKSNATETKQPKSIAYIRVSSQRQVDEGVSLDAQKRRIEQLAEFKGLNLDPDDILIEQGVSAGIPLWERPKGRTLRRKLRSGDYENLIVVSPDIGGVVRARAIAKQLDDADLAIIDKRRPRANEAEVMNLIGDAEGRTAILVDDMVDTAGTLCTAANALKERGALKVVSYCTHAVLSGKALENINNSHLDELVVTDTIPLSSEAQAVGKIRQLTIADLLAESIRRVSNEESISALFDLS